MLSATRAPDHFIQHLTFLEKELKSVEQNNKKRLQEIHVTNKISAGNLLKYLHFRSRDQRRLQEKLHDLGLSSLTSSESHIHRQLQEILITLGQKISRHKLDRKSGEKILRQHCASLFGSRTDNHAPLMVTYESGLADNPEGIKDMILSGMQIARINCAHDSEEVWKNMIEHTRAQSAKLNKSVKIYMDLSGPKIRTTISSKGKNEDRIKLSESEVLPLLNRSPDHEHAIGCSLSGIVPYLKTEQKVYFDDGRIQAKIVSRSGEDALIRIERITGKPRLKSEKGINFPDASFPVQSLTNYDIQCLPFITENSDMLGYSFVRSAEDIQNLRRVFSDNQLKQIPVILKIETAQAVNNLPSLLLECMKDELSGVMIARGDLALEISFERLSEIQEEILWLCEAAHIPVIWATQVLDSLNKSGLATRSEVTDASMAALADCVMINKGKNIKLVLESLKDILKRSGSHKLKKRYIFRSLSIAENFVQQPVH